LEISKECIEGDGRNSEKSISIIRIASALNWPIDEKYLLNIEFNTLSEKLR